GADSDGHRHQLRRPGICCGPGLPGLSGSGHRRSEPPEDNRPMNVLVVLPILIPLGTAAASLLFWRHRGFQRTAAIIGAVALLAASLALLWSVSAEGIQTVQIGGWVAPYGIT